MFNRLLTIFNNILHLLCHTPARHTILDLIWDDAGMLVSPDSTRHAFIIWTALFLLLALLVILLAE